MSLPASPPAPDQPGPAPTIGAPVDVANPATGRPAGTSQLVLLLVASCMAVLGAVLIAPVLPAMQQEFATVPGIAVLVPVSLTVPALMIALLAPFAGVIADRFDRRRLLLGAMVAYSVFGTAPLYLSSFAGVFASRVLVGVCEAAIMTCATTLIGDYWSGAQRSRYLGLQTLVAALSATLFLGLGGALGVSGWRTPFWLYAVAILLVVPMARVLWEPAERAAVAAERGRRLPPVPWRRLVGPCSVTVFGGIVFSALIVELSFVLSGVGVTSTATIGLISAVMSLATAAGSFVFGRVSHLSPRQLLPLSFGLAAVGDAIVFSSVSPLVITVGSVLAGFGTGMLLPTLLTWSVNRLSIAERGRGTGLFTSSLFLGQFLSPLVIAALAAGLGGLQVAVGVLAVLSVVMAAGTLVALRRRDEPLDAGHR